MSGKARMMSLWSGRMQCESKGRDGDIFIPRHSQAYRTSDREAGQRAILRKGLMGRDTEGGRKGEKGGQKVTDTKKTRDTREKVKLRSCHEGNNGRKRKERHRGQQTQK